MRRTPILCPVGNDTLVGTVHVASEDRAPPSDRIGILLLNAGPAPRAGNSDVPTHLADRLAERGMMAFRFDLPGLGDSTGASWRTIASYWAAAQQGCNDEAIGILVRFLCARFALSGLIVGGLCAGAICTLRCADAANDQFAGTLLLEPNFRTAADVRLVPTEAGSDGTPAAAQHLRRQLGRLRDLNELLTILTGESKFARPFRFIRPFLVRVLERRSGQVLPGDVLLDAVHSWRRTLERCAPSLVITSEDSGSHRYVCRILPVFAESARRHVRHVLVPDTNHLLTAGDARRIVIRAVEEWVEDQFPDAIWDARADRAVATLPATNTSQS
jgi:hypothetical protein